MAYQDILYEVVDAVATVTIDRPEVMNAFRAETCEELIAALSTAAWDRSIGVIVLCGAGERAFCTGGDQKTPAGGGAAGGYGGRGIIGIPVQELHAAIRNAPKPVIAKVRGYAIGGGNVLAAVCDLTIAGEGATFGQVGPGMGSVDPGFGTAYLARLVGEKKAREMWYLCRRYSAAEALAMGLVNAVVPDAELDAEVARWCAEITGKSPTALALAKSSINADSDHIAGIANLGFNALKLYLGTDESREGGAAFRDKRKPDFRKHLK